MAFRPDFAWGAATAAYQIEGAAQADGKGPSVWDMFGRTPGAIWNGHTGEPACDHYHRFRDDVALMRQFGLRAYRFSIAWPRVLPEGTGAPNARGLDFYDALVDELLRAGITPYATLFHWDYPLALYYRGGWLNPDSPRWLADYADLIAARLGDRVRHWMTLNEPQIFIGFGHQEGRHAPGLKWALPEALQAAHHTLLAHGRAVQAIRASAKAPPVVGLAPVAWVTTPITEAPADVEAARCATFTADRGLAGSNTWWADPIFFRRYPVDGWAAAGPAAPRVGPDDLELIGQPMDFYGLNIYEGARGRAGADGAPERVPFAPGHPLTAYPWHITPEALYWGPRFFWERYGVPVYITENGLANADWVALDGGVHDPQRIDFTARHLLALRRAASEGVDVRGYFHWTWMDNFDWIDGYKQRFGLVYVDFASQQRIPKDSAAWYRRVMETNGASLDTAGQVLSGGPPQRPAPEVMA